jgi:hypothetical protein
MAQAEALDLRRHARRAYERGRAAAAARVLVVVLPSLGLALAAGVAVEACACLGLPIALAAVGLRWYGRDLGPAVTAGIWFGSLLALLVLAVTVVFPEGPFRAWEALALPAGLAFGWSQRSGAPPLRARVTSAVAASGMAAPACFAVGPAEALLLIGTLAVGCLLGGARAETDRT